MRFDRSHVQGPDASFLGGDIQVVVMSGSVQVSAVQFDSGSSARADSSTIAYVNQKLLGQGTASLGRNSGIAVVTTGSIPSWTNAHIRNSAFVITPFSSSDHESQVLGMWKSGTEPREASPVPASASMYYSKYGRYRTVTVKKTASVQDLARLPTGMDGGTPLYYVAGKGTDITSITGALQYYPPVGASNALDSSPVIPTVIPIDVNVQGKIVDIKVWIELMQTSGSGASESAGRYPLGNLMIALRSPNLHGFHAHPIRNDPVLKKVFTSDLSQFTAAGAFGNIGRSLFGPDYVTPMYRDTFILWEGSGFFGEYAAGPWDVDVESGGKEHFITRKYPCWQRDRSMRTVFCDGAPIPNPRHHLGTPLSGNYVGSPSYGRGFTQAYGFDVPWTSEAEISGANAHTGSGSPPPGWLNGPGGTNLPDEWPTTGSNYGASYIKPVYPLLDPIYQRKSYGDADGDFPLRTVAGGNAIFDPGKWTGYRPGLRGTEVSGTWYLLICDNGQNLAVTTGPYTPTYFRQVRLEFTLASGSYIDAPVRKQSKFTPRRASDELLLSTISGSDISFDGIGGWESYISKTYLYQNDIGSPSEIGRTFGIGLNSGSMDMNRYALIYRVTGTLADVSGSTPGWLLNNRFGTPVIPISSASLVQTEEAPVTAINPQDLLFDNRIVDSAIRVTEAAQAVNPPITRAEAFQAAIISLDGEEE